MIVKNELLKLIGLLISLLAFMIANIIFGSVLAEMKNTWDKEALFKGIKKAIAIALGLTLVYFGGLFIPDLAVVDIGGMSLTVNNALDVIFTAGIVLYAYKALTNVAKLIGVETSVNYADAQVMSDNTEYNDEEEV